MPDEPARRFVAHLAPELRAAWSERELAPRLARMLDEARASWAGLEVADDDLFSFLAERLAAPERGPVALGELAVTDAYLACGCLHGDSAAIDAFRTAFEPEIRAAASRIDTSSKDDIAQSVFERLLVGVPGAGPKLASWAAKGPLAAWVRVVALRIAIDAARKDGRMETVDLADKVAAPGQDDELTYLKSHYREAFKAAFDRALSELPTRERNVLRHHVLDRLSAAEIGAIYQVHRVTVARWLSAIRGQLFVATREHLARTLRVESHELSTIMRLVDTQIVHSVARLLREG